MNVTPPRHALEMTDEAAIVGLQQVQHGLVTRPQARSAGLSDEQIQRRLERGVWLRLRRGVYAAAVVVPTYEQAVLAAVLTADAAWASVRTAAKLHGLLFLEPEHIDVLTLRGKVINLPGVVHHSTKELPIEDITVVKGVPATSVGRTIVNCIPFLPGRSLDVVIDDARRRNLASTEELDRAHAFIDRGHRTGRNKVVPMRPVLAKRRAGLQPGGSQQELNLGDLLEQAGVPRPVQQHPVLLPSGQRFLDWAYPDLRIAIEWDGFADHGLIRSVFDDDRVRSAELALAGWLVLPFTSGHTQWHITSTVRAARTQRTMSLYGVVRPGDGLPHTNPMAVGVR